MNQVIVGIDAEGSEQPALRWASSYAAATGSGLTLVTAWSPDQAELPPGRAERLEGEVRRHAEQELHRAERSTDDVPYDVVVTSGDPEDALTKTADDVSEQAEAIVVGHPAAALAPRWSSSVLRMASTSALPVVIAQGARLEVGAGPILAAVDGSKADTAVLAWSGDLAHRIGTTVHAAFATPSLADSYPHPAGATEAEGDAERIRQEVELAGAIDERIPEGLEVSVVEGDPSDALPALATRIGATLIVTGQGRGPLLDKVPAGIVEGGVISVAVVPAELPTAWHHDDEAEPLAGGAPSKSRWQDILGWAEEALGWATADRRVEAHGELRRLDAAGPDATARTGATDDAGRVLDEAEQRVRRDHGDLAPGTAVAEGDRRQPPEAG
ncbi:universal stress protein [Aquihabitans sp. McL0605]|uniref:universal stress protein n=1 Tax=Aquihabitans sp. McL0605 TaxID=3415671 RepID=UPI003CF4B35E